MTNRAPVPFGRSRTQRVLDVLTGATFVFAIARAMILDIKLETSLLLWPLLFLVLSNRSIALHEKRLGWVRAAASVLALATSVWLVTKTL